MHLKNLQFLMNHPFLKNQMMPKFLMNLKFLNYHQYH
jgi:hypothetical protein